MLERQGAEMHPLDPGPLAEYAAITRVILLSEAYAIHERWLQERPHDYGALMRERVLVGAFFRAVDYVQATRQRAQSGRTERHGHRCYRSTTWRARTIYY